MISLPVLVVVVVDAFSHFAVTWFRVERVLVRRGASRKMPAPAVPLPLKKEMPRRSWGWKPAVAVRARLGRLAWKGRAVTVVLELLGGSGLGGFWMVGVGMLTSLIGWSWSCFGGRAGRSNHSVSVASVNLVGCGHGGFRRTCTSKP